MKDFNLTQTEKDWLYAEILKCPQISQESITPEQYNQLAIAFVFYRAGESIKQAGYAVGKAMRLL